MGNNQPKVQIQPLRKHITGNGGRRGLIIGATGATGQYLLYQLLKSNEWSKITCIHRREIDLSTIENTIGKLTDDEKSKLRTHTIDMEKLSEQEALFRDHDVTFCVLGTTRAIAKTAENYRKVDLYMVRDAGIASKQAGVSHFSLLTSKGANQNIWANDWAITHGLLYLQIKGLAEQEIIKLKFNKTSFFHPGYLERPNSDRWFDKMGVMKGTLVGDVAKVMIMDAESDVVNNNEVEQPIIYEENVIQELAKL